LRFYDDLWLKKGRRPAESFLGLIDPYETWKILSLNTGWVVNLYFFGVFFLMVPIQNFLSEKGQRIRRMSATLLFNRKEKISFEYYKSNIFIISFFYCSTWIINSFNDYIFQNLKKELCSLKKQTFWLFIKISLIEFLIKNRENILKCHFHWSKTKIRSERQILKIYQENIFNNLWINSLKVFLRKWKNWICSIK
jgi:hypothetical protein